MSSSSPAAGFTSPSNEKHKGIADALYAKCRNDFPADHLFYQTDLLKLGVIPGDNVGLLVEVAQSLVNQSLFRLSHGKDDRLVWQVVPKEEAAK